MKLTPYVIGIIITIISSGCSGGCVNIQQNHKDFFIPKSQPFNYKRSKLDKHRKDLIKYISKRSVRIVIKKSLVDKNTGRVLIRGKNAGWGTGTIIRSYSYHSYILTAYHVVKLDREDSLFFSNAEWVYTYLIEKRDLNNKITNVYGGSIVVAKDKARDVAVLQIPYNLNIQTTISHNVVLGQEIHILGYPSIPYIRGVFLSYTHGYVATKNVINKHYKQHDRFGVNIYFGNSGSAVFDNKGQIVGMVNWVLGRRFFTGYFLPQAEQSFGCSASGMRDFLNKYGIRELTKF